MHLALEYLLETLFLRLLLEIGWTAISRGHPSHAKGLATCSAKGVPSFLSYFYFFKTLSNGSAP